MATAPNVGSPQTGRTTTADHYRVLGVRSDASTAEIRAAYRRLAQRHHPDRVSGLSAEERRRAEARMSAINIAWTVLSDPDQRAGYDASRRSGTGSARPAGTRTHGAPVPTGGDEDDEDLVATAPEVRGAWGAVLGSLPWVAILVVLAFVFVFTAYAASDEPEPTTTTRETGACFRIRPGPSTRTVDCSANDAWRLVAVVPESAGCPQGSEGRRLSRVGQKECITRPS